MAMILVLSPCMSHRCHLLAEALWWESNVKILVESHGASFAMAGTEH